MQSFRTEIENPVVEKDILDLERKIRLFREGKIDEERFRSLRLARGVYGQRQQGVQMIRIKLPYGRVTSGQLLRIAEVSDEYSTGRLHITTRQDIQIHHVSLDRTPELWAELEKNDVTLREACGNTVRNVTASPEAGIDPDEPFDVSPYAQAVFEYFLRNPVCQEMGRKFKMAFSSSDKDTALTYIHDLGFIPKLKEGKRGFKVLLGGGLGSQPRHADVVYEFLEAEGIIPFIESVLRIFDRHGERSKRLKARMKFLIRDIGLETFLKLVDNERLALASSVFPVTANEETTAADVAETMAPVVEIKDEKAYRAWLDSNVFRQKQQGYYAVGIKVHLGDLYTDQARSLAALIQKYAADELRLTLRQDILIRHVAEDLLPFLYQELDKLGLAEPGYNSAADITACPGTDTCNLGIASSTGIAVELEKVLKDEYPQYLKNKEVTIKVSGCMNACGQHNMAHIGFQGMSVRVGKLVAPALQILLGGGVLGNGEGRFADKVIKIPSKRGPQALRLILNDVESHMPDGTDFLSYYDEKGEKYFYELLKPLSDTDDLTDDEFIDWGHSERYVQAVGIGECAGVVIDLVATLLLESQEKLQNAGESFEETRWADSIYHSYSAIVNTAKALLLSVNEGTNSHASIIAQFDEVFVESGKIGLGGSFEEFIYQIRNNQPTEAFAAAYLRDAESFYNTVDAYRKSELEHAS